MRAVRWQFQGFAGPAKRPARADNLEYHFSELAIARDPSDPDHVAPTIRQTDWALDLGGGFGQWLVGMGFPGQFRACLEIDESAIAHGLAHYRDLIQYVFANASSIPYPAETFDLVLSRVSLPYMNIPRVIGEVRRVLKPGGRIWITLHSREHAMNLLHKVATDYLERMDAAGMPRWRTWKSRLKMWMHRTYVLFNGHLFEHTGRVLPFINGRYESWQTPEAMKRLLERGGFDVSVTTQRKHTVIEGVKR